MKFYLTRRRSKKSDKLYTALIAKSGDKEIYVTFDRYAINQIAKIQGVFICDINENEDLELVI